MRAKKRLGQHFLQPEWADKLIDAIEPRATDHFIEIGPGPGALTLRLAPRVARLTAVEVDAMEAHERIEVSTVARERLMKQGLGLAIAAFLAEAERDGAGQVLVGADRQHRVAGHGIARHAAA